jgi:uncharacterized membrane protein
VVGNEVDEKLRGGKKVVRERLLSVMLCLVFVMTMFPFSAAAESDHFVTEGDEQDYILKEQARLDALGY